MSTTTPPEDTAQAPTMPMQTAISHVNTAVRAFRGTADDHDVLKTAMETVVTTFNNTWNELSALKARTALEHNYPEGLEPAVAPTLPPDPAEPASKKPAK